MQNLPAAVYTCDAEGRIQLYNEAAVELWGVAPPIGKATWCGSMRLYRPSGDPLPLEQTPTAVAVLEGRAIDSEEMVIERPDGTRRHVLVHPQPQFDSAGRMTGAITMLVDVTDRKRPRRPNSGWRRLSNRPMTRS